MPALLTAVYDARPYDREALLATPGAAALAWRFHEFRMTAETAPSAGGRGRPA